MRVRLITAISASLLSVSALVACDDKAAPPPTGAAPSEAPAEAAPASEAQPAADAPEPAECTGETPLKPGIPGSPGHLIPSAINPNGHSELAHLMREMLAELKAIRPKIIAGEPAALKVPHHRIRCTWPTTEADRKPPYDAMAISYLATVDAFKEAKRPGVEDFNVIVDGCVACHQQTCNGPLAAIEPLRIGPPPGEEPATVDEDETLAGYPWARLRVGQRALKPFDHQLPDALRKTHGVKLARGFSVEGPAMRLLVLEFADQAAALKAADALVAWGDEAQRLFHGEATVTGAWLLIAGFPSHKPVSPEMESARDAYLSSFAGEE